MTKVKYIDELSEDKQLAWLKANLLVVSRGLLSLAEDAGMPDTYFATDSRCQAARKCLERLGYEWVNYNDRDDRDDPALMTREIQRKRKAVYR